MKVIANSNFKNIRCDVLKVFEDTPRKMNAKKEYTETLREWKERRAKAKILAEIKPPQFKDLKAGKTVDIPKSIYEKYSHIFEEVK